MLEKSTRLGEVYVRAAMWLLARTEGVPLDDPRIAWAREQAEQCIAEGMAPREAVRLAADLAFRRYGLPRPAPREDP
ncbi:hypothetical protein [Anaeromyxobacter sp. SG66]|uniref:hypothetical protein n=1 Tax=Anaeromyxobacter sp. SG66 TaxID=2925410 RepID=UPI001F58CE71|nr:hypothetical protein [Anaeromyxobacter sp. SG66]